MIASNTIHSLTFMEHHVKKSHIRGTYRNNFYLCTYNLLKTVKLCGMTGFNNITNSDHCGLYLDLQAEAIVNPQTQSTTPPLNEH